VQLATCTTLLLLLLATPLAWWLTQAHSRWVAPIGALVTLPLVLPPSVLGFYLLVAMGPQGPLGQFTQAMGWGVLSFTFTGLLIGSMVFSLPFAVQPLQHAFESLGRRPMEVAATLRARPLDAFFTVALLGTTSIEASELAGTSPSTYARHLRFSATDGMSMLWWMSKMEFRSSAQCGSGVLSLVLCITFTPSSGPCSSRVRSQPLAAGSKGG
jgi:hypothetical protein